MPNYFSRSEYPIRKFIDRVRSRFFREYLAVFGPLGFFLHGPMCRPGYATRFEVFDGAKAVVPEVHGTSDALLTA
jgi:hypothetical protein